MIKCRILLVIVSIVVFGCDYGKVDKTPSMEKEAKDTVLSYLEKNNLPQEGLEVFYSLAQPKADYSYLYKGGGRCIEFIIYCSGRDCTELRKYPYYEHGEKCPSSHR